MIFSLEELSLKVQALEGRMDAVDGTRMFNRAAAPAEPSASAPYNLEESAEEQSGESMEDAISEAFIAQSKAATVRSEPEADARQPYMARVLAPVKGEPPKFELDDDAKPEPLPRDEEVARLTGRLANMRRARSEGEADLLAYDAEIGECLRKLGKLA